jgi:hypothetical protein
MPDEGARPPDAESETDLSGVVAGTTCPTADPLESGLTVVIGGVEEVVTVAILECGGEVERFISRLTASGSGAEMRVSDRVLDLPEAVRTNAVGVLAALAGRVALTAGGQSYDSPIDLLASLVEFGGTPGPRLAACRRAVVDAAALWVSDPETAAQLVTRALTASGYRGLRTPSLSAEVRRRREELLSMPSPTGVGRLLSDEFDDLPPSAVELVVPAGYRIGPNGLFKGDQQICDVPVIICGLCEDASTHVEEVTLAIRRRGQWEQRVVPSSGIARRAKLVELADRGLPFHDENVSAAVAYLADFRTANRNRLDPVITSAQLGWTDDRRGFLLGRRYLGGGSQVDFRGADGGDEQAANAFHSHGRPEAWLLLFNQTRPFPRIRLGMYASFVPVVAPLIGCSNFFLDYNATTSSGKTTALELIASCWGTPDRSAPSGVVKSWNMTRVARERWAGVCRHLLVVLDESQLVSDPKEVAQSVYELAQGHGRGRGSVQGLRQQQSIHTVAFTSGERPLTSFTQDGGIRARVLCLPGSPFGEQPIDPALPTRLRELAREHYGHAGVQFIQFVLDHRGRWDEWKGEFTRLRGEYELRAGANPVAARMGEYMAAVVVASRLVHDALALESEWSDPVEPLYAVLTAGAEDADRALSSLRHAHAWACSRREHFMHGEGIAGREQRQPLSGWAGVWSIAAGASRGGSLNFVPLQLRSALAEGGYEYDAVVPLWKQRGWLQTDSDTSGRTSRTVRLGSCTIKMVSIW